MPRFLHVLTAVHGAGALACVVLAAGSAISGGFRAGLGRSGGSRMMLAMFGEGTWAFLVLVGLVLGMLAYGSWRVRSWAWALTLVVYGIGVLGSFWQIAVGIHEAWLAALVNGAVFAYAATPRVRRAYTGR